MGEPGHSGRFVRSMGPSKFRRQANVGDRFMRRVRGCVGSLLSIWFVLLPLAADGASARFSLSDALKTTLKENKVIQVYAIGKDIAEDRIGYEKGIYDPFLSSSALLSRDKATILGTNLIGSLDSTIVSSGIGQKNSIGGTSSVNMSYDREITKYQVPIRLEDNLTRIYFKYDQPILRGFGKAITNLKISRAKIGREFSEQQYEEMKSGAVYTAYKAYLNLYLAMEQTRLIEEVRRSSEEIHRIVKEKYEFRKLTITDLNKIEATLLQQDNDLVKIQNVVAQNRKELLFAIYSDPNVAEDDEVDLLTPPDRITAACAAFRKEETLGLKKKYDFELIGLRNDLSLLGKDLIEARDAMKPDLSISAELGVSGYSSTDPYGSVKDISGDNYSARLKGTLMLPLKNTAAKSKHSEVRNRIRQMEVQIAKKEHEAEKTVQTLLEDMESMRKRIALNERVVSITDQNLRNETERLIAEKSTLLDTLQFQTDFSNARLSLIQSKIDYLMLIGTYHYFRREMETFTDDSLYGAGSVSGSAAPAPARRGN